MGGLSCGLCLPCGGRRLRAWCHPWGPRPVCSVKENVGLGGAPERRSQPGVGGVLNRVVMEGVVQSTAPLGLIVPLYSFVCLCPRFMPEL